MEPRSGIYRLAMVLGPFGWWSMEINDMGILAGYEFLSEGSWKYKEPATFNLTKESL